MTKEDINRIATDTADAYSWDRYGEQRWRACVAMLARRGYNEREIVAILRSKWTRWAGDASDNPSGRINSADLARFLDANKHRGCAQTDLNELVAGTFGE